MAAGCFTLAILLTSLVVFRAGAQDILSARGVTLQLPDDFSVELENGKDFQFGMDVKIYKPNSDKKITGPNRWQVSAWFGAAADGSGPKVGVVEQTLDERQSSTPFAKKPGRFTVTGIDYSLAPTRQSCESVLFFCIRFDEVPASAGVVDVQGYPDDDILTQCEKVTCQENPNICVDDAIIRDIGNEWSPDPCVACECLRGGLIACDTTTCTDLLCDPADAIYTPGVCCPTCPPPSSCDYQGDTFDIGAKWTPDVCTACICPSTGEAECVVETCERQVCPGGVETILRQGDCCEVCPSECFFESGVYFHLEEWRVADCTTCSCDDGSAECQTETCPFLDCDDTEQVTGVGQCCAECALECFDDSTGNSFSHGDTWMRDICTTCWCTNGTDECFAEVCEAPRCENRLVVVRPDVCCPLCGGECVFEGAPFFHLEQWNPNPCTQCSCYDSESNCDVTTCPPLSCGRNRRLEYLEDQCCPSCSEGDPVRLRPTKVKIKFKQRRGEGLLKIRNESAIVTIAPIIRFENEQYNISGSNMWQVSAWLSDNGVNQISRVDQILSDYQASKPMVSYNRMNLGRTKVSFSARGIRCGGRNYFVCIRFDLTGNPLVDDVSLFLESSPFQEFCEPIPRCIVRL